MRITGGSYRSRSLRAPRGDRTRPTSDRVREALFGILSSRRDLGGTRVLDLYAGTGALAFEALSRGATSAVLVESNKVAVDVILANAGSLGVRAEIAVLALPVEKCVARVMAGGAPFDLVFADPPYDRVAGGEVARSLGALALAGAFATSAAIVLEHATHDDAPAIPELTLVETRRYGDTSLSFYAFAGEAPPGAG